MLRAAADLGRDADLLQLVVELAAGLLDEPLAVVPPLVHHRLDLGVAPRVQRLEREILELPLERVDAEAVCERRVHLEGLARLLHLLLLGQRADRAQVVHAVGELDQDDPDVLGHRQDHLAVRLGLRLLPRPELDARELRHPVDEQGDLLAELGRDVVAARAGVLEDVVQERRDDHGRLLAEPGADLRDRDRVHDERLAGLAELAGVALGRVRGGTSDHARVRVRVRLAHERDELVDLGRDQLGFDMRWRHLLTHMVPAAGARVRCAPARATRSSASRRRASARA